MNLNLISIHKEMARDLSSRLDMCTQTSPTFYNARCPVCKDSKKDLTKLERLLQLQKKQKNSKKIKQLNFQKIERRGDWRKIKDVRFPLKTHLEENVPENRRKSKQFKTPFLIFKTFIMQPCTCFFFKKVINKRLQLLHKPFF